jgi:hypothetical protein
MMRAPRAVDRLLSGLGREVLAFGAIGIVSTAAYAIVVANALATIARFVLLRACIAGDRRPTRGALPTS